MLIATWRDTLKRLLYTVLGGLFLTTSFVPALAAADTAANLMLNPSVETAASTTTPTNWSADSWGTNTAALTYKPTGHTGTKSLYISMANYSSGDAKWIPDAASVTAGQAYTYSDYYQSSVPTDIDAEYTDASGNVSYVYLDTVAASSTWKQSSEVFTVPASATKVSILHLIAANGWLQTDDFSLTQNAVLPPAPPVDPNGNLIANPSFETSFNASPAYWQNGGWGTNTPTYTYGTAGHTGTKSATVSMTSYTSGDAKWYANPVAVTPGKAYTYSDYYKANVATDVVADYMDASGNESYQDLGAAAVASAWTQYTAFLTVPAGTVTMTIYHQLSAVGTLSIDDVSLMLTPAASPLAIPNSSVEQANGSVPAAWQSSSWGTNTATFAYAADGHTGTKSVKTTVTNYASGDAKWYFNPITTLMPGAQYRFNFWYKTNSQPRVVATFTDASGVDSYSNMPLPLPSGSTTTWQSYSDTFQVPKGTVATTIYVELASNGWLETDDYSLANYTPTSFNEGLVSLTFDDGWASIYTNGLPLLKKYNLLSTQYLISGKLNTATYMTTAQAKALQAQGSEIASHTVTHPYLSQLTTAQVDTELSNSRTMLRTLFGATTATDFASPYGDYNKIVLTEISKYYRSHRSTDVGFNSKDNFNIYNIRVQNVDADTTPAQVADWVNQAIASKTWLVLVYHAVDTVANSDDYSVTPANLDTELAQIKTSGVTVKTMSAALDEVTAQLPKT